ncbi:CAP domain-containing protein [Streptomyces sp. NBC_00335]|uniref:CAP domain-containing protein n=1 Tax=unclassified Streptomyces TaxID=2593676 RepID=UPI0022518D97|nr:MULTISPECIES: CAP domain-containing protein [unclassified Streptomyces]MCX5409279.1 CAP domain-containing protein [Streptomyces sp. NBC_00086]
MKKHRKKTHQRKIAVAVGVLALVAVPTTAMACLDPQATGPMRPVAAEQQGGPWDADSHGDLHGDSYGDPYGDPGAQQPVEVPVQPGGPAEIVEQPAVQPPVVQPPAEPAGTPAPSDSAAPSGAVAEVLALVNKERATVGCPVLTVNAKLTKAAQDHSEDMAAHSQMSHTGSDGSDPGQRITRAGYQWRTYAENVAYGYDTAAKVMDGWMNSPGHKRNILDCNVKEIGIGLAQPGHYWTQDFGATR